MSSSDALEELRQHQAANITADQEKEDEYKETWLNMWNNTTQPKDVSCRLAFDIMMYCFSPPSQLRSIYRSGGASVCTEQIADMKTCANVMAKGMVDEKIGRELLRAARLEKVDPRPHVWKMRTVPPAQFRRVEAAPTEGGALAQPPTK